MTVAPNAGTIRITGQSGQSFTLAIQVTLSQIIDSTLLQTTGNSTTQAMSQKAVTDALLNDYNLYMLEANDTGVPSSPISGLYDSYEKTPIIF